MSRLIAALLRHADYDQLPGVPSAHQPFALNRTGHGQALKGADVLADALQEQAWQAHPVVDSSRMLRAWQTAQVIRERLGLAEVESFDDLAERGLGCAANLSVERIEAILEQDPRFDSPPADWKSNSRYRLPLQGAESLLQAGERVAAHLRRRMQVLYESAPSVDTVKLFVGHGAAFRHAAFHLGVLEFERIAELSMYHVQPVFLEYRQDDSWRQVGGAWKLRTPKEVFTD